MIPDFIIPKVIFPDFRPICPVCNNRVQNLVEHHDHFADFCYELLYKHKLVDIFDDDYNKWCTFPKMKICNPCNLICGQVKRLHPKVNKWISFAPHEMEILKIQGMDYNIVKSIIVLKNEIYRQRFIQLHELGISKEEIQAYWKTKPLTITSNANKNRIRMLKKVNTNKVIKELANTYDNTARIAQEIKKDGTWEWRDMNSFIYWYRKKHNNPMPREYGKIVDNFVSKCGGSKWRQQ